VFLVKTVRRDRSSRVVRCWLLALMYVWLLVPAQSSAQSGTVSTELRRTEAVLVGSSSFNQFFGRILAHELEQRGYQVTRKGVSGAGLARPDYQDMNQVLETLPIGSNTAAVFMYLGVNDAQSIWLYPHERGASGSSFVAFGSAEWDALYTRRTHDFLERICQRGARRAVVLLPVDVTNSELQHHLERIRELQVRAASDTSCAVSVSTAGDLGEFEAAGIPKRMPDGFHMSSLGAHIVWERIQPQVVRLLDADARL
jgi:hypothetical protein